MIKKYEDLGEELIDNEWIKRTIKRSSRPTLSVLFTEESISDKLLKKFKSRNIKKTLNLLNYLIEM